MEEGTNPDTCTESPDIRALEEKSHLLDQRLRLPIRGVDLTQTSLTDLAAKAKQELSRDESKRLVKQQRDDALSAASVLRTTCLLRQLESVDLDQALVNLRSIAANSVAVDQVTVRLQESRLLPGFLQDEHELTLRLENFDADLETALRTLTDQLIEFAELDWHSELLNNVPSRLARIIDDHPRPLLERMSGGTATLPEVLIALSQSIEAAMDEILPSAVDSSSRADRSETLRSIGRYILLALIQPAIWEGGKWVFKKATSEAGSDADPDGSGADGDSDLREEMVDSNRRTSQTEQIAVRRGTGLSRVDWHFQADSELILTPQQIGTVIYARTSEWLYALDSSTGRLLWKVRARDQDHWAVSADSGLVFVIDEGQLVAVDEKTGDQVWTRGSDHSWFRSDSYFSPFDKSQRARLVRGTFGNPVATRGRVVVKSANGVHGVETRNGNDLWFFEKNVDQYTPFVVGNMVLIETSVTLHCLEIVSGKERWSRRRKTFWTLEKSPVIHEDKIYLFEIAGSGLPPFIPCILQLNASTGNAEAEAYLKFLGRLGDVSDLNVSRLCLYVCVGMDLLCLSIPSLEVKWSRPLERYDWNGQFAIEWSDPVVLVSIPKALEAYAAESGDLIWSSQQDRDVSTPFAVANATVYVGTDDGRLLLLDKRNGERYDTYSGRDAQPITLAPLTDDKGVYFAAGSNLYFVREK